MKLITGIVIAAGVAVFAIAQSRVVVNPFPPGSGLELVPNGFASGTTGGSNFLWMGSYPLTGVSFSVVPPTLTTGAAQTLVTNPVGSTKRMFVEGYWTNSGGAGNYTEYKSDGTHNLPIIVLANAGAGTFNTMQYPAMLEPGESFVLLGPASPALLISISVMSFDLSSPVKSINGWGPLPAGATTIYTVPPLTTAFVLSTQTLTLSFAPARSWANIFNFDTTPISFQTLISGTVTLSPLGPYDITTNANLIIPVFPVLTAGQTVALSLSAANSASGVTGYYMIVYERPN